VANINQHLTEAVFMAASQELLVTMTDLQFSNDSGTILNNTVSVEPTTEQDYIQMAMANYLGRLTKAVGGWGILPMWVKDLDTPLHPSKVVSLDGEQYVLIDGGKNLGDGVSGVYRIVGAKVIHINPETKKNKDLIQKIRKLL
jgi:hypothetical protein